MMHKLIWLRRKFFVSGETFLVVLVFPHMNHSSVEVPVVGKKKDASVSGIDDMVDK